MQQQRYVDYDLVIDPSTQVNIPWSFGSLCRMDGSAE